MPDTQTCAAVTACAASSVICLNTAHASTENYFRHALSVVCLGYIQEFKCLITRLKVLSFFLCSKQSYLWREGLWAPVAHGDGFFDAFQQKRIFLMTWLCAEDRQHILALVKTFMDLQLQKCTPLWCALPKFTWLLHCWKAAEGFHLAEDLACRQVQLLSAQFRNSEFHSWTFAEVSLLRFRRQMGCYCIWKTERKKKISVRLVLYPVWGTVEVMSVWLERIWGAIELALICWGEKEEFLKCVEIRLLTYIKICPFCIEVLWKRRGWKCILLRWHCNPFQCMTQASVFAAIYSFMFLEHHSTSSSKQQ